MGNGALSVDGSNTVVAAGALLVGGGGASGTAAFSGSSTSLFSYMGIAADSFPGTGGTLTINSGAAVTLAGALDLADAGGNATGSILVSGSGSRLMQTGSASALVLGSGDFGSASLTIANGATFSALGPLTVNGPASLNISGGSAIVEGLLTGNVIDNSMLDFVPQQGFVYGGNISGSGSLAKDGPLSLTLSGSNDYTGGTLVNAGTLYATDYSALPDGSSLTIGAGGTFVFDPTEAGAAGETAGGAAAAVPEPGTWALLIAGAAPWAMYRLLSRLKGKSRRGQSDY